MTVSARPSLALLLFAVSLAACQPPRQGGLTRPSAAAVAECRQQADRVYNAQNRVELSTRDQRDSPFAAGYNPGITTRGLGALYSRDNDVQSCLNNSVTGRATPSAVTPGTGPTFQPQRY